MSNRMTLHFSQYKSVFTQRILLMSLTHRTDRTAFSNRQLHTTEKHQFKFITKTEAFKKLKEFDLESDEANFVAGSKLAVSTISDLISKGNFSVLRNMVADDEVDRIQKRYAALSEVKRGWIKVLTDDIQVLTIHENYACTYDSESHRLRIPVHITGYHTRKPEKYNMLNSFICFYMFERVLRPNAEDFHVPILTHRQVVFYAVV